MTHKVPGDVKTDIGTLFAEAHVCGSPVQVHVAVSVREPDVEVQQGEKGDDQARNDVSGLLLEIASLRRAEPDAEKSVDGQKHLRANELGKEVGIGTTKILSMAIFTKSQAEDCVDTY